MQLIISQIAENHMYPRYSLHRGPPDDLAAATQPATAISSVKNEKSKNPQRQNNKKGRKCFGIGKYELKIEKNRINTEFNIYILITQIKSIVTTLSVL